MELSGPVNCYIDDENGVKRSNDHPSKLYIWICAYLFLDFAFQIGREQASRMQLV